MKIDLISLCDLVEANVPTVRAIAVPEINQVIVTFITRPDVEISLLTPFQQRQVSSTHSIDDDDIIRLLGSIQRIANAK